MIALYIKFKSIISFLFFPAFLCIGIIILGILIDWLTKKQRLGKRLVLVGAIFFVLFSTCPLPNFLLRSFEYQYPPLNDDELMDSRYSDVRYIVVLGGGVRYAKKLPITSNFYPSSLVRITEGIRLFLKLKKEDMKLIVSGGGSYPVTSAELMARFSKEFEINDKNIIVEKESFTTHDEARFIKDIVQGSRFFLVTSAGHMPRSMAIFKKYGMMPIAAPTDHWTKEKIKYDFSSAIPSADNLKKSELAFYECIGFIKAKFLGQL